MAHLRVRGLQTFELCNTLEVPAIAETHTHLAESMTDPTPNSTKSPRLSESADQLDPEILRIIGNARFEHNVCLMARSRYGMGEFGRLFYLLGDLSRPVLSHYLDQIDEVREGHSECLRCSLKFMAFCRFFCGIQLPGRLAAYEREYDAKLWSFGKGRDFMCEVWEAIDKAKPVRSACMSPSARLRGLSLSVFPTEIRTFRGDFER
jgi:hypothetical protein